MAVPETFTDNGPIDRNFAALGQTVSTVSNSLTAVTTRVTTLEARTVKSTVETLKSIRGIVNMGGSGTIVEGLGFSITRNATGDLTVTFTAAFSDVPAVTVTPQGGAVFHVPQILDLDATFVRVGRQTLAGANVDGIFHFHALGPS